MDISQLIQTILVVGILLFFIIVFFLVFLYKRKAVITIIKKRVTTHTGLNVWRSKTTDCPHYTIDCKLGDSSKIKTLTCSMDMYDRFRVGKKYSVLLGFNEVKKVYSDGKAN